jgi:hypothetical protein
MLVSGEHRERLAHYCMVRKCTQETAVNEVIGEALNRIDSDPAMKARSDRAKELQAMMDNL